jgi:holo-[acyl-carrier protein] synthase
MIIGIGTDLVDIARIHATLEQFGERFVARVFAPEERIYVADDAAAPAHYAKRFAGKEAAAKALRSGIADGVYLKDLVVIKDASGAPMLEARNGAARMLTARAGGQAKIHLSLSDDGGFALAFVVIETISGTCQCEPGSLG